MSRVFLSFWLLGFCIFHTALSINVCTHIKGKKELDECFMRVALDYALIYNPEFPFGALVVDHNTNEISCYGANSVKKNRLLHGETAAFWNCTELYPSPTNDDMSNPGLDWSKQTLYTTGEPCPMCASQSIYRGVGRVVWGTSIPDLYKSGCPQITIRMADVLASAKIGAGRPNNHIPIVEGGVLKEECDGAFWCAFKGFRDSAYYRAMAENNEEDFIKDRETKYSCKNRVIRNDL